MWLFTKHGFYSVTQAPETKKKGLFQIRARVEHDLINLKNEVSCLQTKKIHCYPDADYRYRIFVWPSELTKVFEKLQDTLNYSNFKNEVHRTPNQAEKYSWYTKVWGVMFGYQKSKEVTNVKRKQLTIFDGFRFPSELDEPSEHEADGGELNDFPRLREEPYSEEQERILYGG